MKLAMVPLKSGQIPLPNITLLWERYSKVLAIPPMLNGSNATSPKAAQDAGNLPASPNNAVGGAAGAASTTSPGVMTSPISSSANFQGFNGGNPASQGHPPHSLLVEIGYPADLRYIFVKPNDINF